MFFLNYFRLTLNINALVSPPPKDGGLLGYGSMRYRAARLVPCGGACFFEPSAHGGHEYTRMFMGQHDGTDDTEIFIPCYRSHVAIDFNVDLRFGRQAQAEHVRNQ